MSKKKIVPAMKYVDSMAEAEEKLNPTPAPEELDEILDKLVVPINVHRVGSHSDDYGGDSDKPCYCTLKFELKKAILAYVDKREKLAYDTGFIAGKDATLDGLALTNSKVTEGDTK